jgi:hypothetical protein
VTRTLDACRLKLARAYEQGEALGREFRAFLARNPYGEVQEFDSDTSECVFSYFVFEEPPPIFGILIGEFVHSVSSALEQLVWQLVILDGGVPEEGATGFPIFTEEPKYRKRAPRMIRGMSAVHKADIEGAQPYNAPNPLFEPLALLRDLWNQDKHRLLTTTMAIPGYIALQFKPFRDVDAILGVEGFPGALEHGAPLARVKVSASGPNPKVVMDGQTEVRIAFAEGGAAAGLFVDETWKRIYGNVEAIIRTFLHEFPL